VNDGESCRQTCLAKLGCLHHYWQYHTMKVYPLMDIVLFVVAGIYSFRLTSQRNSENLEEKEI